VVFLHRLQDIIQHSLEYNIHPSWDVVSNRIRLGGLICSLKTFLHLNMCNELQIILVVYVYSGAGYVFLGFVILNLELLP
jgi:hypothetical protein